jgi:hypothetical protein
MSPGANYCAKTLRKEMSVIVTPVGSDPLAPPNMMGLPIIKNMAFKALIEHHLEHRMGVGNGNGLNAFK